MRRIKNTIKNIITRTLLPGLLIMAFCGCGSSVGTDTAAENKADVIQEEDADAGKNTGSAVREDIENQSAAANVSGNEIADVFSGNYPQNLTVNYLDVGQGNATLLSMEGHYLLIDGGNSDKSSFVVSYLEKQGVEKLDMVIASHYDADHLNGIVGALNKFDCDLVLAPDYEADSRVYTSYCSVVKQKNIKEIHPVQGEIYSLGDALIAVEGPVNYNYSDANDNSIVVRVEYGDTSFLFCGDAEEDSELDMIESGVDLSSDVILLGHHGSRYSTSEGFLNAVSPQVAVVSAGVGNSYGHPHLDTMMKIFDAGIELYRTDIQGTVSAVSNGRTITWSTEACTDYSSGEELDGEHNADEQISDNALQDQNGYVLNKNTKKFHRPSCSSVKQISDDNREDSTESKDALIAQGYEPCKRCNP